MSAPVPIKEVDPMQIQTRAHGLGQKLHNAAGWLTHHIEHRSLKLCLLLSPLLTYLIESVSRHSPFKGIVWLGEYPVPFLFNTLLILTTLLLASLFRRRLFFLLLTASVWLFCGVVNGILLSMRVTPFGFSDFRNVEQAIDIVDIYMKPWQIVLCVAAMVLTVALLVWMGFKSPRYAANYKKGGAALLASVLALVLVGGWAIDNGHISEEFGNLADCYRQYGFCYCFTKSVFDQGVDRPADYSGQLVQDVIDEMEEELSDPEIPADPTLEHPNIIIVQLESFFNVNRMNGIDFSGNPIAHFTRMMEENTSGYFTVPSIGAGTVNTEFEVLTGMSLDYFGTGEYPYKTILRESGCPSLAYDLKDYGYSTFAIHNNNGTFYDRHKVYPNLGFDHFLSIEYMDNIRENALGWAKDSILTEQILKCLDSGENSDFVYTVAVQPHGRYPTEPTGDAYPITASGLETMEEKNQWEYYVGQLYETDQFVAELTRALDGRGEPYICVFYGDHLPSLDILDEDLSMGNIYQTEYVIATNLDGYTANENIYAYQLSAKVLEMAGLEGNVLFDLHRTAKDDPEYQRDLELLEYDILYGDQSAMGGSLPYTPTEMQMGVDPITIEKAYIKEGRLYVEGTNVTWESYIFVNGKPWDETTRIGKNTLCADAEGIQLGDAITVVQMGGDGEPLSATNPLLLN